MHGSYARLPCGVTLTGSLRAHVPHALLSPAHVLEGASRAPGAEPGFPSRASHGKARGHKSDKICIPG